MIRRFSLLALTPILSHGIATYQDKTPTIGSYVDVGQRLQRRRCLRRSGMPEYLSEGSTYFSRT